MRMSRDFMQVAGWPGKLISYNLSICIWFSHLVAGWPGKLISYNSSKWYDYAGKVAGWPGKLISYNSAVASNVSV